MHDFSPTRSAMALSVWFAGMISKPIPTDVSHKRREYKHTLSTTKVAKVIHFFPSLACQKDIEHHHMLLKACIYYCDLQVPNDTSHHVCCSTIGKVFSLTKMLSKFNQGSKQGNKPQLGHLLLCILSRQKLSCFTCRFI